MKQIQSLLLLLCLVIAMLTASCQRQTPPEAEEIPLEQEVTGTNEREENAMWVTATSQIRSDITENLANTDIVDDVTVDYKSGNVNITVAIEDSYAPEDIAAVFNSFYDYNLENWFDGQQVDAYNTNTYLSIINNDDVLYEMKQTVNSELTKWIEASRPSWLALKWPEGEKQFSFLYPAQRTSGLPTETSKVPIINNINIFATPDITNCGNFWVLPSATLLTRF